MPPPRTQEILVFSQPGTAHFNESVTVPAGDEMPFAFTLDASQMLKFEIAAERPITLLVCTAEDYEAWLDAGACVDHLPTPLERTSETDSYILSFRPPESGDYVVTIINAGATASDVEVSASAQPE
jgi:hypothetical protein